MDLKNDERDFHDRLHPDVAKVLYGKRILLWQQMLESIGYEDMGVLKKFATGTPLVGKSEVTGLWPRKFKPASMTATDLGTIAAAQRPLSYDGDPVLVHRQRGTTVYFHQAIHDKKIIAI